MYISIERERYTHIYIYIYRERERATQDLSVLHVYCICCVVDLVTMVCCVEDLSALHTGGGKYCA